MEIEIREFLPSDSILELTELIHVAYKTQSEMGFHFVGSSQSEEITQGRIAKAKTTLVAMQGAKYVATISLYASRADHPCEHYRSAWYFGQFAVRPDLQKQGIGTSLIDLVEQRAKEAGASRIALDTAETAQHLIRYYEKRGYEFVQFQQWPDVKHRSIVLSKQL